MRGKLLFPSVYEKDLSIWDHDQCNVWFELPDSITDTVLLQLRYVSEMGMLVHLNTGDQFRIPSENEYNFIWHADAHFDLSMACDLRMTCKKDTTIKQEPLLLLDPETCLSRTELVSRIAACLDI